MDVIKSPTPSDALSIETVNEKALAHMLDSTCSVITRKRMHNIPVITLDLE